jgi:hypothetical protein
MEQIPLFGLAPAVTRTLTVPRDGVIRLDLPNWSTAWEIKTGRGGWPKLNPTTGKVIKHRKVWDALAGNARPGHWSQRHTAVKEVILAVVNAATTAGLQPCQHLTIQIVWAPGHHRKADDDNLWHIQKAAADALARGPRKDLPGLHLVADDDQQWMAKLAPRIDRPPSAPGLWLEVQQR